MIRQLLFFYYSGLYDRTLIKSEVFISLMRV